MTPASQILVLFAIGFMLGFVVIFLLCLAAEVGIYALYEHFTKGSPK